MLATVTTTPGESACLVVFAYSEFECHCSHIIRIIADTGIVSTGKYFSAKMVGESPFCARYIVFRVFVLTRSGILSKNRQVGGSEYYLDWRFRVMKATVKRFITDERGLETVEYAIILGLIVAATISAIVLLGHWVRQRFQSTVDTLAAHTPPV